MEIETKYCNDIKFDFTSIELNAQLSEMSHMLIISSFDDLYIFLFGLIKIELLCAILRIQFRFVFRI